MSAAAPVRRPSALRLPVQPAEPTPSPRKPPTSRPRLVLVSQRRPTAGRLPFLIVIGLLLVGGLVGVLLLHTVAAQDAFRATALQQRLATLTDQEQRLSTVIETDSAPQALRARAAALGMVPTTVGKFHRMHDGRTVGVQTPVYPPPTTVQATSTTAGTTGKQTSGAAGGGKATTPAKAAKTTTTTGKAGKTATTTGTAGAGATDTAGSPAHHVRAHAHSHAQP
jgi:hypothetical protein